MIAGPRMTQFQMTRKEILLRARPASFSGGNHVTRLSTYWRLMPGKLKAWCSQNLSRVRSALFSVADRDAAIGIRRYMYYNSPVILLLAASIFPALSIPANASPFTIDGSTVYVNAGFVGVRTSTPITVLDVNGDAQFGSGATKSTFTATGLLKLTSSGIQWADGTTSTTSAAAASSTQNSTYTYLIDEYTNSGANMGPCISGSTITFTTSGNPVEIIFDFSQAHGASGGGTRVQVLMDGARIDDFGPLDSMAPMSRDPGASSTVWFPTYLHYRTNTAPSAGAHSFCITFERNAGGVSYITCKKAGTVEGPKKCLFMVRELK